MFVKKLKHNMKFISILFLLIAFNSTAHIDRTNYFSVFESNSLVKIEAQINSLRTEEPSTDKDAFLGAMIMKKAQFMKTPKEKIAIFKEGKTLLENAIAQQAKNATYRFLRLAVQENCPKILKYNTKIESDAGFVKLHFASLSNVASRAVKRYAKESKHLSL